MPNFKMTKQEFVSKIEWEGGVLAALEYGLRSEDTDDIELSILWQKIVDLYSQVKSQLREIESIYQKEVTILIDDTDSIK